MIHGMMIVRNECERELVKYNIFTKVLEFMNELCDRLVVVDDSSTDETYYVTSNYADETYKNNERKWDKNEVSIRKDLWNKTISKAKHGDWIICLDADELIDDAQGVRYLLNNMHDEVSGIGFKLYDMWSDTHYRDDKYWTAHKRDWVMAIRYDANRDYVWNDKKLHCGRFPFNSCKAMLPTKIPIRHYGWALEDDRKKKYDRYVRIDGDGKHGILAQYKSILDENPNLVRFGGAK